MEAACASAIVEAQVGKCKLGTELSKQASKHECVRKGEAGKRADGTQEQGSRVQGPAGTGSGQEGGGRPGGPKRAGNIN